MEQDYSAWLEMARDYLKKQWGLDSGFADSAAVLLAYLYTYGLNPIITSGYRSPEKQQQLSNRYAAGDRSVVVQPAKDSLHTSRNWLGQPAAKAIDIQTNNPTYAAQIAQALGLGAGLYFRTPDPVHFYQR